MKILFAAAECAPFFKTGGLGDVMGSLPKSLAKNGNDVRVVVPFWRWMPNAYQQKMENWGEFYIKVGWRTKYVGVHAIKADGVTYLFLDNRYYFDRQNLYGYYDDGERWAWFQQAVIELMQQINFIPDILHCNDFHTAMIPFLLKEKYGWIWAYSGIKTVLTIHNLKFQGQFGRQVLPELFGMQPDRYDDGTIRMGTAVNYLKAGIFYADKVTTVSPSYAAEIQTPDFGCGLDEILRMCNNKLSGILNGIDYDSNNPATDPNLVQHFDRRHLKGKVRDKAALQQMFGLPVRKDVPLIGMVSRLTSQKGFQLVVSEMMNMLNFDLQFAILGTGDANYEHDFWYFSHNFHNKCAAMIKFDPGIAQQIYGGADMFLMPSGFEPCGLSQMIAERYGTLPIVHQIGGLRDTVEPYNQFTNEGDGFGFEDFSGYNMVQCVKKALATYKDKKTWRTLMDHAMSKDFSWRLQSQKYIDLYHELV